MASLYKIEISKVLYQFDGPILFVAKVGMLNCLFLKTDETDLGQEFISCYIDERHLEGLVEGRLSVRGAFEAQQDTYYVLTTPRYEVLKEVKVEGSYLEERLPEPNVGVFEHQGECPDVLQEKDAFLSVYFRGGALNRDHIPYSTLMKLLSNVQSLARNVLVPPALRGAKASTFDFLVGDPALGSLMISIKKPTFNLSRLQQSQNNRELTREAVNQGTAYHKDHFFSEVEELIQTPFRPMPSDDIEEENVFESIKELLPSDDTPYTNVSFSTQAGDRLRTISISREKADRVRSSYSRSNSTRKNCLGVVVEINAASRTLLLRLPRGAIVTCSFSRDAFDELRENAKFVIGAQLLLTGNLTERTRRDFLEVESYEFRDSIFN